MALQHVKAGEVVNLLPLRSELKTTKTASITKSEHFEAVKEVGRWEKNRCENSH